MLGVCLTVGQRQQLEEQARLAGLSLSEYARRKMFGGRPIVASADLKMLAGLNKFGGLIKIQCSLIRSTNGGHNYQNATGHLDPNATTYF